MQICPLVKQALTGIYCSNYKIASMLRHAAKGPKKQENIRMKKRKSTCSIAGRIFRINNRDVFLYSGEMHYFRIPRRYWEKHLSALIDAGCNAVSTYVPWSWHEFKEGQTDLTGKTHPERDLAGFLDLAGEMGLYTTVKPGPYIMAETTDQGIPRWLVDDYPETQCLDHHGHPWGPDYVTYASSVMREKSARWLRLFARKIVLPRQSRKTGAVIQMQLCNEIGMFQWLGAKGDYSRVNVAYWQAYLAREFGTPEALSILLDRPIQQFSEIQPPQGECTTRREYVLYHLWHQYYRWLYADYVAFISKTLREQGVTVPFFTNIGGWVYGRAHEFPLNATFHKNTVQQVPDVYYGIDHIPEFISPSNTHDGIVATQITDEMQQGRKPLYSAELQCGSREHGVQPYPDELALFYRQCLIHGLTGMNFYMFAQGKNPKGRGIDGPMFYWYTAVDYKGKRQAVYPAVQQLGEWLQHNSHLLIHSERPANLAVGYYPPMFENEFLYPKIHKINRVALDKIGIMNPVEFRDKALFDGAIRVLVKKSVPYDMADITQRSIADLLKYRALAVLSNEIMDPGTQQKLCDYVKAGGRLIIFPMLPRYDSYFSPCRILEDTLDIHTCGRAQSNRVYMGKLKDIPVVGQPFCLDAGTAEVLARSADKKTVGIEKKYGKGTVRCFGFHLYYTIEEHPQILSAMMEMPLAEKNAWANNELLQLEARFKGDEGLLFAGNVHRAQAAATVTVRHPETKQPVELGQIALPPQCGVLLPINIRLNAQLRLVYALGELLERSTRGSQASFTLRGPTRTPGRVALKSRKSIREITIDGTSVPFTAKDGLTVFDYIQTGQRQTIEIK
jgi:beta-galactosidase